MYEEQIAQEMREIQHRIAHLRRRTYLVPEELLVLVRQAHHAIDEVLDKANALQDAKTERAAQ